MKLVLTWHAVGEGPAPLWCGVPAFERQLDALAALDARVGSMRDFGDDGGEALRIALTFDDGYANFIENAWPRLRERGFGATVYVIAGRAGADTAWPGQRAGSEARLLRWEEISELAKQGCDIGSHCLTHVPLTVLPDGEKERELAKSREMIEAGAGVAVTSLAYPYGAFDTATARLASRFYETAVTTRMASADGAQAMEIPRIDAFYLDERRIASFGTPAFARWVAWRAVARRIRRVVRPDWRPADFTRR